jgi:hypothetical protein
VKGRGGRNEENDYLAARGRFAKALGEYTVGSAPTVEYPKLPDGSPWRQQQPPNEEPFGIDIQYVEPCGTDAEIERAAAIADSAATDNLLGGSCADAEVSPPSAKADPLPPLLTGSATSAPLTSSVASVAVGREVGGADPSLGSSGPSFAGDQQLAAGPSPPDATSPPPDVAAARSVMGPPSLDADPPSSGDQDLPSPSILAGAPRKGANAFGLNSYRGAGSLSSITRRFG